VGEAVGSAGLFSTVPDLLVFAEWLLKSDQVPETFLGWEKNADWMPSYPDADLFGKSGFTGCGLVFDPRKNKAAVLLTNATYPHRPQNRVDFNVFRKEMLTKALAGRLKDREA
jgi:CubicO group peptidase (beta-lactamase class C family)